MNAPLIPLLTKFTPKPRLLDGWAQRILHSRLSAITTGALHLIDGEKITCFGQASNAITITISDSRFYGEVVFGGSIGAGEAYMLGYWQCNDFTGLIRQLVRNAHVVDGIDSGWSWLTLPLQKLFHWFNRNSQSVSARNIAAHYDLGNELFQLFLDPTMMYSCGIFESPSATLEQASVAKLRRICEKLALTKDDHVLEIGTGWGGFAIYAASQYGCRVTTTTISQAQFDLALIRIKEAGLSDRITLLLEDYRVLTGEYDKLVSIEMIEAVGYQYYDTFFGHCAARLKPSGIMLLQAITITDQRYEQARRSVDFIQRYIFPGSCIPSVTALLNSITAASDMRLFHLEDIGPHYAKTLAAWRANFFEHLAEVKALGYPDTFIRMWEFYLCYCEGGFEERALGDVQMLLVKPENRHEPILPKI
ncbi:MAG: class I SAM-dependent methyltransferase [Methylophilaceae bacterium]